jgi:site-specific DNA recombinase
LPSRRLSQDPYRQGRKTGRKPRPKEEWIPIGIPRIVDEVTWEAAQAQLRDNALHSRRNNKRHQYLLRGLIRCPRCGGTYTGAFQHGQRFYRCGRTDPSLSSTGRRCPPGTFRAGPVEEAVWEAVTDALQSPTVLVREYQQRLMQAASPQGLEVERKHVSLALKRVRAQEDRVTDGYVNEAMDLERYKAEMDRLRQRCREPERAAQEIDRRERQELDSRRALEHLEAFCQRVAQGLDNLTFEERQHLLQLLVERITVENERVRVDVVMPTPREENVQLRTRHPERVEGCAGPETHCSRSDSENRDSPWQCSPTLVSHLKFAYKSSLRGGDSRRSNLVVGHAPPSDCHGPPSSGLAMTQRHWLRTSKTAL